MPLREKFICLEYWFPAFKPPGGSTYEMFRAENWLEKIDSFKQLIILTRQVFKN